MSNLREKLIKSVGCALKIRDDLGVQIADVYIVERSWSGQREGDGELLDTLTKIVPTPQIMDYSHDVRIQQGGSYKSGDLILKSIPLDAYTEEELRTDTGDDTTVKYIKVGNHFYRTVHVKEKTVCWDIHITKVSEDETERD